MRYSATHNGILSRDVEHNHHDPRQILFQQAPHFMTSQNAHNEPSRNAPCPCGSGRKFKRCCGMGKGGQATPAQAVDRMQQVITHYRQGNLQAAAQLAEQLLRSNPDDTGLLEITAVVALQTGNVDLAIDRFRRQISLQPENALAYSNLCLALHTLGKDGEAFDAGKQAIHLDPQLADAWNNLGNVYKAGNHLQGALEHYEKALELERNNPELHVNAGVTSQLLGDLETAERRYRDALKLDRKFAYAHNNLATVLQKQEHYDKAEAEFRIAMRMQPGNPEFLTNMGTLMLERGEDAQAKDHLEKAMRADPDYVGSWVSMGSLYDKHGDHKSARHYWDKALLLDPENSTVHCNLGYRLYDLGEQQAALDHFVRALKSNPNSAKGLAGLGKVMLRQDQLDKATEYIERALKLAPWDIHAHIAKAYLYAKKRDNEATVSAWRYVIEHSPTLPEGYIGLGSHYWKQGQYDEARATYQAAEANGATSLRLYNTWSQMEEQVHRLDRAEELAEKAVSIDANYPGLKILQAKLARRRKDNAAALDLLLQVNKDAIDVKQTKANYLFELGSVLDKLGRYQEAFAAYREANEAKNCYVGRIYDLEGDQTIFRELKKAFSKDTWPRLSHLSAAAGDASPQPIFIVGFPRSGTSLLEQILGSHREISPAGELSYLSEIEAGEASRITGSPLPFPLLLNDPDHPLDAEKLQAMRDYYLSAVRKLGIIDDDTRWVTDKLPHNATRLGMIRLLFPTSPIIHISRHPLNPCLSAYFANFSSSHRYTSSLAATARHYRDVMELLDHYRNIGIDFLEIHYEDLVGDQETVIRQILEYIGAPWDDACLQHHKSDRVVRTASYEQVTQKVYTSSLYRYQNYWDAVQEIIPILQPTIERFGYTVEPPPER